MVEDDVDMEEDLEGIIRNTPSSPLAMNICTTSKCIGTGPGDVILTGGRSSFKHNCTLSKVI